MEPRVFLSRCLSVTKIELPLSPSAYSIAGLGAEARLAPLAATFSISQTDRGEL
jgi:hypothetical protein